MRSAIIRFSDPPIDAGVPVPRPDPSSQPTLSDYARVILIHKWLILAIVVACAGGTYLYSSLQTTVYTATARLLYQPPTNVADPLPGGGSLDTDSLSLQLQSVGNTINTPAVTDKAREELSAYQQSLDYSVAATVVAPADVASDFVVADAVEVTAQTSDPEAAATIANTYARAVIELRKETEQKRYRAAQKVVEDQMKLFPSSESKLSADYTTLVQQLRNLKIAEATVTGDFIVASPATPPSSPSSPRPIRAAAIGFGVGLVAGVLLAFAVAQFETRVRTRHEVAELLGMPILGRIPRASKRDSDGESELVTLAQPDAPVSEAMRMLRTSLDWASIDDKLSSIIVTSSVKGEGKTLTACNLAVALACAGKSVVLVDADLRDPRVHQVFGLPNARGLSTIVLEPTPGNGAVQRVLPISNAPDGGAAAWSPAEQLCRSEGSLYVITSGPRPPNPGEIVASHRMATVLDGFARPEIDYVLIDAPPLLGLGDTGALAESADGLVMIVDMRKAKRPMLQEARERLDQLRCRKLGIVTVGEQMDSRSYYRYGQSSASP